MTDWTNWYKLKEKLLTLSNSKDWSFAKNEWTLDHIYYIEKWEEYETCSCGHNPIQEVCVIRNLENHNSAIVWNICVQKFIDQIDSWNLFDWFKRISKDLSSWPSRELIEYVFDKWHITQYEYNFCKEKFGKKNFYWKQMDFRKRINQKILTKIKIFN